MSRIACFIIALFSFIIVLYSITTVDIFNMDMAIGYIMLSYTGISTLFMIVGLLKETK